MFFHLLYYQEEIKRLANGGAQENLSQEIIAEQPILLFEDDKKKTIFVELLDFIINKYKECKILAEFSFNDVDITYLKSAVFAVFMMAITFNGFNARTSHINPFEGLGRNKTFIWVMLSVFALQFVFITFGGEVLSVESLSVTGWLTCIALAFLIIPIDMIRKAIMRKTK